MNKEIPQILRYAYEHNVETTIDEGANLNDVSDESLEALVRYQTSILRCAIDGVTQSTYEKYRVGANLKKVIANIKKINSFKAAYRSLKPVLIFQFVIFGHNEHETERAKLLASMLKMKLNYKLNFSENFPVQNRDKIRALLGYSDRKEYMEKEGRHYMRNQCYEMWIRPQINWDGKLLGCSRNFWGFYSENVFQNDLIANINNEKISYARDMLMGLKPLYEDIPCKNCGIYKSLAKNNSWITEAELKEHQKHS
ncbi:MAG: radical SAM protein [Candidatus Riflebacteria bacterium]|nr:radical SAM protein [Candidatus Riflebacteria bacterium]